MFVPLLALQRPASLRASRFQPFCGSRCGTLANFSCELAAARRQVGSNEN
jgi:hypothetical protein